MEQVDQDYLDELLSSAQSKEDTKSDNKLQEPEITYEQIQEMAKKMGRGDRDHDMIVIVHFIQVTNITLHFRHTSRNIFT